MQNPENAKSLARIAAAVDRIENEQSRPICDLVRISIERELRDMAEQFEAAAAMFVKAKGGEGR